MLICADLDLLTPARRLPFAGPALLYSYVAPIVCGYNVGFRCGRARREKAVRNIPSEALVGHLLRAMMTTRRRRHFVVQSVSNRVHEARSSL